MTTLSPIKVTSLGALTPTPTTVLYGIVGSADAKFTAEAFANAMAGVFTNPLLPATSDIAALGSTTKMWSDLFLASGSVINWNNGDLTLTHAANLLTLAGGYLAVPDEAYGTGWNGSLQVPTKNAVYDILQLLGGNIFNVKAYGAVGNGSTDDTTAITAAIAAAQTYVGGTVYFPTGTYRITTGITIAGGVAQNHVNVLGDGPVSSVISWDGSTSGIAVTMSNEKYVTVKGIKIDNAVAEGTTVGLYFTGTGGGTQTSGSVLEGVAIDGFNVGLDTGATATSSEMVYVQLTVQNCGTGIQFHDFNAIGHHFLGLNAGANTVAIDATTAHVHILGGSGSNNDVFLTSTNGGPISITNFYIEANVDRVLILAISSSVQTVSVNNCNFKVATEGTTAIQATGAVMLSVMNSTLNGDITAQGGTTVTLIGNGIYSASGASPIVGAAAGSTSTSIVAFNNTRRDFSNVITGSYDNSVPDINLIGDVLINTASATAFLVGPNGATNPTLKLVTNVSSAITGLSITGKASGAGVSVASLGGTNENITLLPKGTGQVDIRGAGGLSVQSAVGDVGNPITVVGGATNGSASYIFTNYWVTEGPLILGTYSHQADQFVLQVDKGVSFGAYQQLTEMTAPAAGAANTVRLFAVDNGSGKTVLKAQFATGIAQVVATEP